MLSWYNGVLEEGVANRVLFALGADSVADAPRSLRTTAGWRPPPPRRRRGRAHGARPARRCGRRGGRLPRRSRRGRERRGSWGPEALAVAASWDVFSGGEGADHVGPDAALVRRVLATDVRGAAAADAALGPVFWLADGVPWLRRTAT